MYMNIDYYAVVQFLTKLQLSFLFPFFWCMILLILNCKRSKGKYQITLRVTLNHNVHISPLARVVCTHKAMCNQ